MKKVLWVYSSLVRFIEGMDEGDGWWGVLNANDRSLSCRPVTSTTPATRSLTVLFEALRNRNI